MPDNRGGIFEKGIQGVLGKAGQKNRIFAIQENTVFYAVEY